MENAGVGWIAAIIIGGLAGWLAEKFMKSEMGLFMNIVLGIVGAALASAILSGFGITLAGWIGYLIGGLRRGLRSDLDRDRAFTSPVTTDQRMVQYVMIRDAPASLTAPAA
jgi:uncharacterized membrane protein YeaQ/YmgE (transglycosylase-associated protein family)